MHYIQLNIRSNTCIYIYRYICIHIYLYTFSVCFCLVAKKKNTLLPSLHLHMCGIRSVYVIYLFCFFVCACLIFDSITSCSLLPRQVSLSVFAVVVCQLSSRVALLIVSFFSAALEAIVKYDVKENYLSMRACVCVLP